MPQPVELIRSQISRSFKHMERAGVIDSSRLELSHEQSEMILNGLSDLVNSSATMTESQACRISTHIMEHMLGKPSYPGLPEMLMLASYINTCKA